MAKIFTPAISKTIFQEWLHSSETEPVETSIDIDFNRTGWNSIYFDDNLPIEDGVYRLDSHAHLLYGSTLIALAPELVSEDPNIQVAYPDNFLHNWISEIQLYGSDQLFLRLDSAYLDGAIQLIPDNNGPGQRDHYLVNIGNNNRLNSFQTIIPETGVSLNLPWRWKRPFPLFLMSKVEIRIKLRPISDIIRVLDNSSGKNIYRKYQLSDPVRIGSIQPIRLINKYGRMTEAEVEFLQERTTYINIPWIDQVDISIGNSNRIILPLELTGISQGILLMAENLDAREINNLSTYGTDSADSYQGEGPIVTIQDFPANYFASNHPGLFSNACPERPGYYLISLSGNNEQVSNFAYSGVQKLDNLVITTNPGRYHLRLRSFGYRVWEYNGQSLIARDKAPTNYK